MRTQHTIDHLDHLTAADAHRAAWSPLDPDVDFPWTEEVACQLETAAAALLQAARTITAGDRHGRALQAVAARFGAVAAAMLVPEAAAVCQEAARRISGCRDVDDGHRFVRTTAEALLSAPSSAAVH